MNAEPTHIPRFVAARTGQVLDFGDHRVYIKLSASEMASDIVITGVEVDPGGGPPRHLHTWEDEISRSAQPQELPPVLALLGMLAVDPVVDRLS